MNMDPINLINVIETHFDGAPRTTTSLWQFQLTDRYGMSRVITAGEWAAAGKKRVDSTWQEIPDDEIKQCDVLLAHMEPAEFLYYLPAYMRYALKNCHKPIWETDVLGMTVSSLSPSTKNVDLRAYAIAQYSALNEVQRQVVNSDPHLGQACAITFFNPSQREQGFFNLVQMADSRSADTARIDCIGHAVAEQFVAVPRLARARRRVLLEAHSIHALEIGIGLKQEHHGKRCNDGDELKRNRQPERFNSDHLDTSFP